MMESDVENPHVCYVDTTYFIGVEKKNRESDNWQFKVDSAAGKFWFFSGCVLLL